MARGLIGYDLPSENEPGISQKRKTDRNTMRRKIWQHFKVDPDSEQLQDSLWLVNGCDEKQMLGLLNDWGEEYRRMKDQPTFFFVHLPANINIIWIGKKKIGVTRRSKK